MEHGGIKHSTLYIIYNVGTLLTIHGGQQCSHTSGFNLVVWYYVIFSLSICISPSGLDLGRATPLKAGTTMVSEPKHSTRLHGQAFCIAQGLH